jgi:hypothetical protein
MGSYKWGLISSALLLGSLPTASPTQVEPKSPVHITVNGVLFLCPRLVRNGGSLPSNEQLAALGFELDTGQANRGQRVKAIGGVPLFVSYDGREKRCVLDYAGAGYRAIAGVIRDMVTKNGFKRLTGGDRDGAKADVFEGPVPGGSNTARIIIIENYSQPSAAISYAER